MTASQAARNALMSWGGGGVRWKEKIVWLESKGTTTHRGLGEAGAEDLEQELVALHCRLVVLKG